jgi:hypothetical protein
VSRAAVLASALPLVIAFAVVACNGVLGIPEVERLPNDAGPLPTTADGAPANGGCPNDMKPCNGRCVSLESPTTGCGGASCEPCKIANGTARCQDGACAVDVCSPGWGDCNLHPDDGCEQRVDDEANCGSCSYHCQPGFTCNKTKLECDCQPGTSCVAGACLNGRCVCGSSSEQCFSNWFCTTDGSCTPN